MILADLVALGTTAALLGITGCGTVGAGATANKAPAPATYHVEPQPPPNSCHARARGMLPDPRCTPGATDPRVTPATIHTTICIPGWSAKVRPPESVTEPEKLASMRAYGIHASPRLYEYDHLIPLSLGGAPNAPANLWPERGAIPNAKDVVELRLHLAVCSGREELRQAQRAIATNWLRIR